MSPEAELAQTILVWTGALVVFVSITLLTIGLRIILDNKSMTDFCALMISRLKDRRASVLESSDPGKCATLGVIESGIMNHLLSQREADRVAQNAKEVLLWELVLLTAGVALIVLSV